MQQASICPLCSTGTLIALNQSVLLDMTHPPYERYVQKYECSYCHETIEQHADVLSSIMNTTVSESASVSYIPANYSYWHGETQVYPRPLVPTAY